MKLTDKQVNELQSILDKFDDRFTIDTNGVVVDNWHKEDGVFMNMGREDLSFKEMKRICDNI